MAAKNNIKVALVTLLTLALVFCMIPMAFATDTVVEAETDSVTSAESVADAAEDTAADIAEESTEDTAIEEADETNAVIDETGEEDVADTTETSDGAAAETEEDGGLSTGTIVSIVIVAVIVIVAAVYCIKNREKVAKFFREVRSECKKIVWTPWKTVRKNTFVVVIIVIVFAIVIGALDLLFSKGIVSLGEII